MYFFCFNERVSKPCVISLRVATAFLFNAVLTLWLLVTLFVHSIHVCHLQSKASILYISPAINLLASKPMCSYIETSDQSSCKMQNGPSYLCRHQCHFHSNQIFQFNTLLFRRGIFPRLLYPSNGHVYILDYI